MESNMGECVFPLPSLAYACIVVYVQLTVVPPRNVRDYVLLAACLPACPVELLLSPFPSKSTDAGGQPRLAGSPFFPFFRALFSAFSQTVLLFSAVGIPLSTTHCAVGSTVGVGLMEPRSPRARAGGGGQRGTERERSLSSCCGGCPWGRPRNRGKLRQEELDEEEEDAEAFQSSSASQKKSGCCPLTCPSRCLCINTATVNWRLFGGVFVSWIVTIAFSGKTADQGPWPLSEAVSSPVPLFNIRGCLHYLFTSF